MTTHNRSCRQGYRKMAGKPAAPFEAVYLRLKMRAIRCLPGSCRSGGRSELEC